MPRSELSENDHEFLMKVEAPGLSANDIIISAMQDSIVVQANIGAEFEMDQVNAPCPDLLHGRLCRRFDLRPGIDVERVTATLENGVLRIVAAKLPEVPERRIPVTA